MIAGVTQLALFDNPAAEVMDEELAAYLVALLPVLIALTPPSIDEYTLEVARGGLAHFRKCLRSSPADQAAPLWIAYFERMRDRGYRAAQAVYPQTFRWIGWGNPYVIAARKLHGPVDA